MASASLARNGTTCHPRKNGPKHATGYSNPVDTSPHSVAREPGTASPSQSKTPDSKCATPSHGYTGQDSPSHTMWGRLSTSVQGHPSTQSSGPRSVPQWLQRGTPTHSISSKACWESELALLLTGSSACSPRLAGGPPCATAAIWTRLGGDQ